MERLQSIIRVRLLMERCKTRFTGLRGMIPIWKEHLSWTE